MFEKNAVVAVYNTHKDTDTAIKRLKQLGIDMWKFSILGKDYHKEEQVIGFYNTGEHIKFWGKREAFWNELSSMLSGSAVFIIPGIGHIMVLGALAGTIFGVLEKAKVVGGLSALGAGLYSIGIPKESILEYETAIKADKFLLIAQNMTVDEMEKSNTIIQTAGTKEIAIHASVC